MREFRLRRDLTRATIGGFALPLGLEPGDLQAPRQGYTVSYSTGEDEEPDTYTFQIVVSHERLATLCDRCFGLLPERVFGIIEIGSRDAYRSVDVYLGREPVDRDHYRRVWRHYAPFLLEDGSIAVGANGEDPFVEVFIDQHKAIALHVPLSMRDQAEEMLQGLGLEEVSDTWAPVDEGEPIGGPIVRPVLDLSDEHAPDVDELLLRLRRSLKLELNLDPETNLDEAGRNLGLTLWHSVVIVYRADGPEDEGAYMSAWLTGRSLSQAEQMISAELDRHPEWEMGEFYTIDRVAYDERPDELGELSPRRSEATIHLVHFEPWGPPAGASADESAGRPDGSRDG